MPNIAGEIVGDIGHADLHLGPSIPIVRMKRPNRLFWWAKTCSASVRTFERRPLERFPFILDCIRRS